MVLRIRPPAGAHVAHSGIHPVTVPLLRHRVKRARLWRPSSKHHRLHMRVRGQSERTKNKCERGKPQRKPTHDPIPQRIARSWRFEQALFATCIFRLESRMKGFVAQNYQSALDHTKVCRDRRTNLRHDAIDRCKISGSSSPLFFTVRNPIVTGSSNRRGPHDPGLKYSTSLLR